MTGVKSHAIIYNRHGEELLNTMPPILALYARFVHAQCTEQLPWTSIPTIGIRSHRNSCHQGLSPLRQSNYKDKHATPAIGPGMTEHVATTPKDINYFLNSGTHARTRSSSARSTDAMPPQYRPRHHQIRPSRGLLAPPPARSHLKVPSLVLTN
jgi:hypothetical protein